MRKYTEHPIIRGRTTAHHDTLPLLSGSAPFWVEVTEVITEQTKRCEQQMAENNVNNKGGLHDVPSLLERAPGRHDGIMWLGDVMCAAVCS